MDGNSNTTKGVGSYCQRCGCFNEEGNRFCTNCGNGLTSNETPKVNQSLNNNNQTFGNSQQVIDNNPAFNNSQLVSNSQQVQQAPKPKVKGAYIAIGVILGIASLVVGALYTKTIGVIAILGIISLFKRETRAYGITLIAGLSVAMLIGVVFVIIMFGTCFAALGGL